MNKGDIVTLSRGPHFRLLGDCPGLLMGDGLVRFNGVAIQCQPNDLTPALLWVRKGQGDWIGPLTSWPDAMAALAPLVGTFADFVAGQLERGRVDPNGAYTFYEGWRWRVAWGGPCPPLRFDN